MSRVVRRLFPPIAAAFLALAVAGTALAARASVSVFNADGTPAGATVCEFYFEFNPVPGGEAGSWALRDASDATVEQGAYAVTSTEGDRHPDTGSLSLPNGTYLLLWDDEDRIDNSNEELEIVVDCAAAETDAPSQSVLSETDAPSQSVLSETDAPSQSVLSETDAPSFGQSVGGITEAPIMTQPDTSAVEGAQPDAVGWSGVLLVLFGALAIVILLTPRRRPDRRWGGPKAE